MDSTLLSHLENLCRGLHFFLYRKQNRSVSVEGLLVYACCVKQPALEQNMHVVLATALWPTGMTQPPEMVALFDHPDLVWQDIQMQNVRATESEWPNLLKLLCPDDNTDEYTEQRKANLQWTISKAALNDLRVHRTDEEVLPGYITYKCYRADDDTKSLARVLVLNRHVSTSTPLMLRNTTGLESDGTLYAALKEWSTRIVPPV